MFPWINYKINLGFKTPLVIVSKLHQSHTHKQPTHSITSCGNYLALTPHARFVSLAAAPTSGDADCF